jgi:CheY-like chemotaxis protein
MARSYFVPAPQKPDLPLPFTYPALVDSPLILCVDDDPGILELLEDVLTACGLRAVCTSDRNTALRLIASEPIDLVVLDYQMPQMDGLSLAQAMRRYKSQVPMILFSGALLPCEALDIVSRIIRKGDGALPLASAILETLSEQIKPPDSPSSSSSSIQKTGWT